MNMTVGDINRTYGGTFLAYRTDHGIMPLYVECGTSEDGYEEDEGALLTADSSRVQLDDPNLVLTFPDVGMTQVGDTCYWLVRKAERQWHRGIRARSFVDRHGLNVKSIVQALHNPECFSLDTYKDRVSSRLSLHMKVTHEGKIVFRDTVIASYDGTAIIAVNQAAKTLIELEEWYDEQIGIIV